MTDTAIDLTDCDREPIHIPGAIQPHGLLLVADAATLQIVAGAGDIEGRLTRDWLGADLVSVIGQDIRQLLAELPGRGSMTGAAVGALVLLVRLVVKEAGETTETPLGLAGA